MTLYNVADYNTSKLIWYTAQNLKLREE